MSSIAVLPLSMRRAGFDPAPELTEIRDGGGIPRVMTPFGREAWLITRYDDVKAALADPVRFSNAWTMKDVLGTDPDVGGPSEAEIEATRAGNLLAHDPPEHTRLRRMLTGEFTMKRMRRLAPRIDEIITDHLDAMERHGAPVDLVAEFAAPIPALVICELLGVPTSDRVQFQERTSRQMDTSRPPDELVALQMESHRYMSGLVERSRVEPGDDLLGMLVREHGDDLTENELVGIANLLLVAGHETTSNMLGLGLLALLRHPEQLAMVRDDPTAVVPAVEELMRWLSVVHSGAPKITTTDVNVAGNVIPAGELVVLSLPAANRDPVLVDDPDRLDVTRGAMSHLGFGHGIHHCLGAPLARMEMQAAFPAILRRFPTLALADNDVEFRSFHLVYGLKELTVTWS